MHASTENTYVAYTCSTLSEFKKKEVQQVQLNKNLVYFNFMVVRLLVEEIVRSGKRGLRYSYFHCPIRKSCEFVARSGNKMLILIVVSENQI